jgi:endonuclease/exonuclease/phosphatase family metal-dependent hydrolase
MKYLRVIYYCITILILSACVTKGTDIHRIADGDSFPADNTDADYYKARNDGTLKIVTLNVAHGRNQAANQLLLNKEGIKQNILNIASVLKRIDADVVALQEADGPSAWSGNFDHVELIARTAGYPWYNRADHAQSWLFSYGTAVLSRLPVDEIMLHTFSPSPPTLNKGFLLSKIKWTDNSRYNAVINVDVVSVHLDFSRHSVREVQIAELSAALSNRENPMVILGDFNSDWFAEESIIKRLAEKAGMSVYKPFASDLHTYKSGYRYDWILISSELAFVNYDVLPDLISDHLAVVAEIMLKEPSQIK